MNENRANQKIGKDQKRNRNISKWTYGIVGITILGILSLSFLFSCSKGENKSSDEETKTVKRSHTAELTGSINEHEWVDLGLPSGIKWATCNVGATEAEEFGNYYAWGEIEPKSEYTSINSITYKVPFRKLRKSGIVDESGILTAEHDVASIEWGKPWRMPTMEEFSELIDECTWNFASFNGVNGYLVTGPNKKNIFLPAAGFMQNTTEVNIGDFGDYWSSTVVPELSGIAHSLGYSSKSHGRRRYARYAGRTIRPVTE